MVFGECIDVSCHEWKQKCDRRKKSSRWLKSNQSAMDLSRLKLRIVLISRCRVFSFIANTYLLTTQDVSTPALPRLKHVLDLSILSVFGFRSNKFASYVNNVECVWHSLDASLIMIFITAVCRWVGAFDWPVTAIIQAFQNTYILSKTCREKCAEVPPAHRTESL